MQTVNTISMPRGTGNSFLASRKHRTAIFLSHALVCAASAMLAFLLRFDFTLEADMAPYLAAGVLVWAFAKPAVFQFERLDRWWPRSLAVADFRRLLSANAKASMISALLILFVSPAGFPRSIYVIEFVLSLMAVAGLRLLVRFYEDRRIAARSRGRNRRVLIYGAGEAGEMLLQDIRRNPRLPYRVAGFVDDSSGKRGLLLGGLKVLGDGGRLAALAADHRIDEVLIAIPSASGEQMSAIVQRCRAGGIPCKTVPGLAEILEGRVTAGQVRDVAMEDLLGRRPVQLDDAVVRESIEGRVVMVTGAGGSIGSELCRQIARFRPSLIVGYEISENALYELNNEMRERFAGVEFLPAVGSIQNPKRLTEVVARYRPSVIYHAAAYKHVPMMEDHIFEAVENNVFGTFNVVRVAREFNVERFVLISSDKAVRPTNVMGATKRVAELIVKAMQNGGPKFVAVRFGNVLGSNGSVIPLFKRQIAAGGPVTVTHPDMERYFMTISEAVQLVLQAAAMGQGGEIFVLDMGEPVKIVDLARNLIILSGFRPDQDIKIEFTGIRPGEKLREELNGITETTVPTRHEKIRIFTGPGLDNHQMRDHLRELRRLTAARLTGDLVDELQAMAPDYQPSDRIAERAGQPKRRGWRAREIEGRQVAVAS